MKTDIQFSDSLKTFIVPAIDIINGKCVRLTNGDFAQQKIYNEDPVEMAKHFAGEGFQRLHLVDLDGARSGEIKQLSVLEKIAKETKLTIDFGGGVTKISDVENILNAGAAMVTIGSLAAKRPEVLEEWLMELGVDKFFIGADVLNQVIKISGWQEETNLNVFAFVGQIISLGTNNIFCTDISKDGLLEGPSVKLYEDIIGQHPEIKLTASGGVSTLEDVVKLREIGCHAAIIGKALYEGTIDLTKIK